MDAFPSKFLQTRIKTTMLSIKQYVGIGLVLSAFLAGWYINGNRHEVKALELQDKHNQALLQAAESYQAEAARLQEIKDNAIEEAKQREQQLLSRIASTKRNADSLQQQLTESTAAVANLSQGSCVIYADTVRELFGQCIQRYTDLAGQADKHVNDIRLMTESWPTNKESE